MSQGISERICKFSSLLVASTYVESTKMSVLVLSTLFLGTESTEMLDSVLSGPIGRTAAEVYGIRHLKAGSAAQPKGCSACFVLVTETEIKMKNIQAATEMRENIEVLLLEAIVWKRLS